MISQSEQEAMNKAQQELDKANAAAGQELADAREKAKQQCEEISRIAEKNRPRVIQSAADALLN